MCSLARPKRDSNSSKGSRVQVKEWSGLSLTTLRLDDHGGFVPLLGRVKEV